MITNVRATRNPARVDDHQGRGVNEFEFLCALLGSGRGEWSADRASAIDTPALDWNGVLRLAEFHGVLPLVACNLIGTDDVQRGPIESAAGLPQEVGRSLRSAYESNLRRSLWFTTELARIMQHFERDHLRAVPFKGPALAQSLYGDPALRSFSDLDFLISSGDFMRAKQSLAEIGYRPTAEYSAAVERLFLKIGYERSFDGIAGKNLVELQWALLPHFYGIELDVAGLLARAGRIVVGGCEMPCLSSEDSLLVLCVHAGKHLWMRLIWLSDVADTLRNPHIDYALVFSRAQALGVARILGVSFWLAKNLLHAQLPQPAEEMIAADPLVPVLGKEFAERLARGATYDFESTEYFRLILKLRERHRDRWKYIWRLVWTPGEGEVEAVRLPEPLFPLYRIVRIGRLMRKLLL